MSFEFTSFDCPEFWEEIILLKSEKNISNLEWHRKPARSMNHHLEADHGVPGLSLE